MSRNSGRDPYKSKEVKLIREDGMESIRSLTMPQKKRGKDQSGFIVTLNRSSKSSVKCKSCGEVKEFDYPFTVNYCVVVTAEIDPFKKIHQH